MDKKHLEPHEIQRLELGEQREQEKATYFSQELAKSRKVKRIIRFILVVPICIVFAGQLLSIGGLATPIVILFLIAYLALELMLYLRTAPSRANQDSAQLSAITQRGAASAVGASLGGFAFLTFNQLYPETNDILALTAVSCGAGLGFVLGKIVDSIFSPLNRKIDYYSTYLDLKFHKDKGLISKEEFDRYDQRNNSKYHTGD
jgi:hypothetical protein